MQQQLKLAIGCDVAGYDFKCELMKAMEKNGYRFVDVGCESSKEGVYVDAAKALAKKVSAKEVDYGILICGTGQGMAMAANKVPGIRAALAHDVLPAVLSKEHNNANVLCMGAWMIKLPEALRVIEAWLIAGYNGLYDDAMAVLSALDEKQK